MIAIQRDVSAIWRIVGNHVVLTDLSTAVTIQGPAVAHGVVIWTENSPIRIKVLDISSSDKATATDGILLSVEDGRTFIPLWDQKLSIIQQSAGARVQYFFIEFQD